MPARRSLRSDLLIVAALFVLPLVFFWPVTLGDRTLLPADNLYQFQPWAAYREQQGVPAVPHNMLLSDLVLENLEWKHFIRGSLGQGEIPLWNPYLFAGVPFLAAGQHSALYPFSLIYYTLPLDKAYGWFTVSQVWLAGLFMYLFMRGLGVGRLGGLIAAIAYQLSSFFIASVVFQMIIAAAAWLPLLLLMVEFTIRRRPLLGRPTAIPWVALGALGLGITILAGHIEFVYYALLVMGFWSACRLGHLLLSRAQTFRQLMQPAAALFALVVLGMGVGAVQFIPLYELANSSSREGQTTFEQVRSYAFPPRQALAFLMPNIFGSPAQHDYFDVFTGRQAPLNWWRADYHITVTDSMMLGGKNYVEGACYVGLLTLVLAAIGLLNAWFERKRTTRAQIETAGPYRAILALLALISVTFIFGTITYAILYYGLPGISQLHSPFRWVFPLTLCLAALAGFGAEALSRAREDNASFTFRLARWLGWALIGAGGAVLAGLLASRVFFERLRGPITSLYNGLAGATLAYPSVEVFYSVKFRDVLFFGLFLLASGIVVRVSRCPIYLPSPLPRRAGDEGRRPIWEALALIVLALDLVVASAGFNPAADPKWLTFEPPAITWLKSHDPQSWRFTTIQGPTATLNANVGWLYGLQDIRGYDSIIPKQYVQYMEQIQPQSQLLYNRIAPVFPDTLDALNSPYLNLLGVKYVVSENALDTAKYPQYEQVYQDEAVRIYENTQAVPRAFTVRSYGRITEPCRPSLPLRDVSAARITESRGVQVSVEATGKDYSLLSTFSVTCLVLADSYAPGWRAYIRPQDAPEDQEKEVSIGQAFGNFRSISLPPGAYTVRFRYSPPSFQVGAFATFLALVVLIFMLMLWLWRRFYTEPGSENESGGVHRFAKNSMAPILLNLFNRSIDLAFAFIMLRLLGPANAGTYYYAVVIYGWFDILTNFGLNTLLIREVARDRASAGKYLLNSSALRLGLAGAGIPLLIGFLLIRGALQPPLDPVAVIAIVLLYAGLVPNSISTGLSALFYAFEKAEVPAAISTVTAILKATLGLAALLAGWGVLGLAAVSILLNLITLAILAWSARGLYTARRAGLDREMVRGMIGAGWPLMITHLLATIFFKIDVVILEPLRGATVVGQYSTAYKWLDALGVIPSLFTMALLPIMSRQAVEDKSALERYYHFAVKLMFGLALPIAIVTTFIAHFLINLLGGARYLPDGAIALQLMVWFIPVGWINSLTSYVLIALDQQKRMRWALLAGVSFNIITNLLFIPLYSYRAAAVVTALSEVVLLTAYYVLLRRALAPVPWIALLWKFGAAGLIMAGTLALLWPAAPLLAVMVAGGVYPGALLALRPFNAWELGRIAALLPGRLRRFVTSSA